MKLRDQCEHGRWDAHGVRPSKVDPSPTRCPGGREVTIYYEAVEREMRNRRVDRYIDDPDIFTEAARAFADAALGEQR